MPSPDSILWASVFLICWTQLMFVIWKKKVHAAVGKEVEVDVQ